MGQRGFSLLEVLVAAAMAALVLFWAAALSGGAHPGALSSSVDALDASLAYARSLAATGGNGATLVFTGSKTGFKLTVYAGRPTAAGAMTLAPIPPFSGPANISEAILGPAPFTLLFDSAGHASALAGALTPASAIGSDPGCPPSESQVRLTLADSRGQTGRSLPCRP